MCLETTSIDRKYRRKVPVGAPATTARKADGLGTREISWASFHSENAHLNLVLSSSPSFRSVHAMDSSALT